MEALMKAINDILKEKNTRITILEWEKESLEKDVASLRAEIAELKVDIEKYKENEVNRDE